MGALVGNMTSAWSSFNWTLLFARQPEPDLEFTEEELDQTSTMNARSPMSPRKKSGGGSPILWVLVLALVGGIAYLSMEQDKVAEWLSPYLGESTPPPVALKPKPVAPAPVLAPPQAAVTPSTDAPVTPVSPAVVPPPQIAAQPVAPVATPSDPMFSEGQKVTITGDNTTPDGNITLFTESSSNKPGPIVRPGVLLTVMDGDLQPVGWVYLVRTDEGVTGWVSEKRLRLKF
ncbi:MAG: hypothetical protein CAF41_008940 [Nitrospira sp. CG24A]|nr:MAG: hypothetical protein CAF41_008940 [Nitrospira sp. CG24A]